MTAAFQGEADVTSVAGNVPKGHLPKPAIQALQKGSFGPVKSDMQVMADNERKQHEQTYIYENGHNDHGMGQ